MRGTLEVRKSNSVALTSVIGPAEVATEASGEPHLESHTWRATLFRRRIDSFRIVMCGGRTGTDSQHGACWGRDQGLCLVSIRHALHEWESSKWGIGLGGEADLEF